MALQYQDVKDLITQIMQDIGLREEPEDYRGRSFNRLRRNDAIKRLGMVLARYHQNDYPVLPLQPGIKELLFEISASESVRTLEKTWFAIYHTIRVHIELVVYDCKDKEQFQKTIKGLRKFLKNLKKSN